MTTLRIYDSILDHRISCRLHAMLAVEACNKALAEGMASRLEANFEQSQNLRDANAMLAMACNIYASVAVEEPADFELHPGLEAKLLEAVKKENTL